MNANYTLLGFLANGSNYGYELKKLYDGYFGRDKPILAGQIYSTLSRLKRDDYVTEVPKMNKLVAQAGYATPLRHVGASCCKPGSSSQKRRRQRYKQHYISKQCWRF